jgi:hypothetical protein
MSSRSAVRALLIVTACVGGAVALLDITAGGFYFRVFGIRISSWEADKPFRIAMLAIVALFWLHDNVASPIGTTWHRLPRAAPWVSALAAVMLVSISIRFGIFAAGGADGYGYVSQAHWLAVGRLAAPDRLASVTPLLGPAVAPLGFRLARDPGWLVPVYPAGLPMLMAGALRVAGPSAVYFVVPLLGGLTVWLTYVLGRRVAEPRTAMLASLLVAFSPIVVFQSLEPMSDVPATAFWMAAWVFATSAARWAPLASGLAVSAAVLTRPNLVPLTLMLAYVAASTARPGGQLRSVALFSAGVAPGCGIVAALNAWLYGSPLQSGYGPLEPFYAWDRFTANAERYPSWLVDLHTPAILLAFIAPLAGRVRAMMPMVAFIVLLFALYLFYVVFDSWPFVRFLLPAIPLMFILGSNVVMRLVERAPVSLRGAIVFLLCTLVPVWYVEKARRIGVFGIQRAERRYVEVGEAAGRELEPNAVVLTVLHSGSIRMYGDRATVRWDLIEPERLDLALRVLRSADYVPYLVLEEWEEQPFRERFGRTSVFGRLDWPAMMEYTGTSSTRIYSLSDRDRHIAGQEVVTRRIGRP